MIRRPPRSTLFPARRSSDRNARVSVQHPVGLAANDAERDGVMDITQRRIGSWGGVIAGTPDEDAAAPRRDIDRGVDGLDRKSTRLNSSHANISYGVLCLKKK